MYSITQLIIFFILMGGYTIFFFFEYKENRGWLVFSPKFYLAFSIIYLYICHADVTSSLANFRLAQFYLFYLYIALLMVDGYYYEVTGGQDLFEHAEIIKKEVELEKKAKEEESKKINEERLKQPEVTSDFKKDVNNINKDKI